MRDLNKDLTIIDGDFDLTTDKVTLQQSQDIIISSDKGKIYNNLLLGVGITKYLNGPFNIISLNADIKTECEKDGIIVYSVQIINGQIYVENKL